MKNKQGDVDVIQMKKTSGTLTVKNISTKKVRIVGITTYNNTQGKYLPSISYNGTTKSFNDTEASAIFGAKVDTGHVSGSYAIYSFVVEVEFTTTTAADLQIKCGSGGAFYMSEVVFY